MAGWYKPSLNSTYFRFMTVYGIGFPHYNLQKYSKLLTKNLAAPAASLWGAMIPAAW